VPYAIHANTADSIVGGDKDTQLDSAGVAALGYVAGAHKLIQTLNWTQQE